MAWIPLQSFEGQTVGSTIYHGGDGFFYHLVNNRPNRRAASLRCIHYGSTTNQCRGTAQAILLNDRLRHLRGHDHDPNVWLPMVRSLRAAIMGRVRAGDQTPFREIWQQEGQMYPPDVRTQVAMGPLEVRLHAIRREIRPPIPRNLGVLGACLLLPQYHYLTRCMHVPDSTFAGMCGNLADGTLSLVFITPEMAAFMETRSSIFADGTERRLFRKPKASQIFVISAVKRFHVIPLVRAIMLKRIQNSYLVLFEFLMGLMPTFNPKYIKCDYEKAQFNSWLIRFPLATVEGCLWHFAMAVWRMARFKLELYWLIKDEEVVASIVRAAGALPLLSTHEIEKGLEDLGIEAVDKGWMDELRPFFVYMQNTWMPLVDILSVKGSVHRTNNAAESANRMLNKEIKVPNPNCFQVLRAFVATNERATFDKRSLDALLEPGRGRRLSALVNDAQIKRLTTDLENEDINRLEFLHKASRRLQSVFNTVFR